MQPCYTKRRRPILLLPIVFELILAPFACFSAIQPQNEKATSANPLDAFVGVDLKSHPESASSLIKLFQSGGYGFKGGMLYPDGKVSRGRDGYRYRPVGVWHPRDYYLVAWHKSIPFNPSNCSADLFFFSNRGPLIKEHEFVVGKNTGITGARLLTVAGFNDPVLELDVSGDDGKEIVSVNPQRVSLIRFENSIGELHPVRYSWKSNAIGPPIHLTTVEQIATALNSKDNVEIISALTWLQGEHVGLDSYQMFARNDPSYRGNEDVREVQTENACRSSNAIKHRVAKLTHSTVPWIKESALFTQLVLSTSPYDLQRLFLRRQYPGSSD